MAIEYYPRNIVDRPSTRIEIDDSAVTGSANVSDKPLMIIGSALDGKPNTVYKVRNLYDAKQIFRGGELLDAMELAWNPSPDNLLGAGEILAMRVEDALNASHKFPSFTIKSKLYSEKANDITVSLETTKLTNGVENKKFRVQFAPDRYDKTYYDVGLIATISKEEEAPKYLAIEVADKVLTIYSGESEEENSTIKFPLGTGEFAQSLALINGLNSVPGIKIVTPITRSKNLSTNNIEDIAKTPITAEKPVNLNATAEDLATMLEYDPYVEIELDESLVIEEDAFGKVQYDTKVKIEDFETTALKGGKQGDIPPTWGEKFRKFANEGGYYLIPLTDSESVHAEATAFVTERYENGDPMRTIIGSGWNESVQQLLNRANAIRSGRALLVGSSGERLMQDGRTARLNGYMVGAIIGGVASGLSVGSAITFKQVGLNSLSTIHEPDELDALNVGGVVMIEFVRDKTNKKFRIVDDVTTYNDKTSPVKNQMGVGESSDFLVSELKIRLDETFIGDKAVEITPSTIRNNVISFLSNKKAKKEIQGFDTEDIQVIINGDVARIAMTVYPTRNLKKINVDLVYATKVLES